MKPLSMILLCFFSASAHAASILWNEGLSLEGGLYGSAAKWVITLSLRDSPYNLQVYTQGSFLIEKAERKWIRSIKGNGIDLSCGTRYITAEAGDVISSETVLDESRILLSNREYIPDNEVTYNANQRQTLYLGFESTIQLTGEHPWDPVTETIIDDDQRIYGWIELIADDMTLTLGNTCIDLSGRPVVVGVRSAEPVPEPATGALALLGAALLFRRRRTWLRAP